MYEIWGEKETPSNFDSIIHILGKVGLRIFSRFIAVANRDREYTCRKKHNRFWWDGTGGMYAEGLRTARIHNIRRGNKSHRSLPLFLLSTPPSPREMEGSWRHVGESKSVEGATMRIHGYCVTLRVHEFFSRACILSVNTKLGLCTGV